MGEICQCDGCQQTRIGNSKPCYKEKNKIKKGSEVRVLSRPEGQTSSLADVDIGDIGIVQYIDGCCLCVKTDKDEFTANASRFELTK